MALLVSHQPRYPTVAGTILANSMSIRYVIVKHTINQPSSRWHNEQGGALASWGCRPALLHRWLYAAHRTEQVASPAHGIQRRK